MLQDAEDNYYITSKYLLELASRAYELFTSSEVEERRQLIKLVPSNVRVEGKEVCYDAAKPFDVLLNCTEKSEWLESRTTNITKDITKELSCIINAFSDFRIVAQIREEIEKVKNYMAISA